MELAFVTVNILEEFLHVYVMSLTCKSTKLVFLFFK